MKLSKRFVQAATLTAAFIQVPPATAVILDQIDDFEDGTTEGWRVGTGMGNPHPAPPSNQLGGPAGASDNYMLLTSFGGRGSGSRLAVFNFNQQWSGDFISAGVARITMDVNNFGAGDLSLRLLLANSEVLQVPTHVAVSSNSVQLPAGTGWTSVEFPIGSGDLTAIAGTVNGALTTATELWIFHSIAAEFPPDPVVALLGVDNITAQSAAAVIPEPWSFVVWGLLALTACGVSKFRRSR
jgi:hypothetical protein